LYADPDPDPTAQINADPCGSGSGYETLAITRTIWSFEDWLDPKPANVMKAGGVVKNLLSIKSPFFYKGTVDLAYTNPMYLPSRVKC
jgi:hypothetical protein